MIEFGSADFLKKPHIPQLQQEALNRGDLLWTDGKVRMYYPENPLVPATEGMHIRIESPNVPIHPKTPAQWKGWLTHWAKAIGAGKVLSEGRALPDMWQSFIGQNEYSPTNHLVTDIIGRNPTGASWGKTAPLPDPDYNHRQQRVSSQSVDLLGKTLTRYFKQYWLPELKKVELFPAAPRVYSTVSRKFQEIYERNTNLPYPWASEPLLVSDTVEVIAILEPHLKTGMHLMIGLNQSPKRPWRNVTRSLEGLAAAEMTAQILEETNFHDVKLAAWTSVRATGSWFKGFMEFLEDPEFAEFKNGALPAKWIKRERRGALSRLNPNHDPKKEWTMGIGFHPHLYIARFPDEHIKLTQRPKTEGGADWEGITVMNPNKRLFIRNLLNEQLMPRLLRQVRGPIV